MVKIGIFAAATAGCTAMILFSIPTSSAVGGSLDGKKLSNGIGRDYLDNANNQKYLGLTKPVKWSASNATISFGYSQWQDQYAFVKCVNSKNAITVETKAFDILDKIKDKLNIPGRDRIMLPLKRFDITTFFRKVQANCFIYTLAYGVPLDDFIDGKTLQTKAEYLPQIFYQAMQGILYLRRVGIIHGDIAERSKLHSNIIAGFHPTTGKVIATIVDYDLVHFVYTNVERTLQLAPLTELGSMEFYWRNSLCKKDDIAFIETAYGSVTGMELEGNYRARIENLFGLLDSNSEQLAEYQPVKSNQVTQGYPKLDALQAGKLQRLVNAMIILYTGKYKGCEVSNTFFELLKPVDMK
ncbi:hypothetical protein BDF19DRAFT_416700 [Syncephalis fuscata]|nr:hypothetical protein BDF19DRAFT_416700 [Syncephalis fuscata]